MNLSRLAAYRRQMEDIERMELAACTSRLQEAAARAAFLEEQVSVQQRRYAEAGRAGLSVDEATQWYAEIAAASSEAAKAAAVHGGVHGEWTKRQATLLAAMQERKKLDILLARRREVARQAERDADQRLMDEQAARRRQTAHRSLPAASSNRDTYD
jgi:flagellar export protein FliJ